jgi:hypothetical protein
MGACVAELISVGKELQISLMVLHCIVSGNTSSLLEAEDALQV